MNSTFKKIYDKDIINNNTDDCRYDSLLTDPGTQGKWSYTSNIRVLI